MVMDTEMAVDFANSFLYGKKITDYLEAKYKRFCEAFEEKEHWKFQNTPYLKTVEKILFRS